MAKMSSEERMMRVLRREEPDRIPHFEWLVDRRVRQALVPGCKDTNDFLVKIGADAVLADVKFRKEKVGEGLWRSEWGYVTQDTPEEHGIEVESPIKSMADLEAFAVPDVVDPVRYENIERMVDEFAGDKAVIVHLNDVFSLPRYLMGMQDLLMGIALQPELVKALVDLSVEVNLKMAKEVAARGVKIVYTGDDFAYTKGPMMSPKAWRELFDPGFKQVMGGFKEAGLLVIKHCDGNLWPILDMVIDAGFDCLDPIDPIAGMDIAEVKTAYGDRVAIKGNVDCAHTLTFGTVEEVVEETKEAMRKGMPGGGYILSSSNSIHSAVMPENYRAMLDTWIKYRDYPISF
jgi:uroporphyrinogen decarboxylase